MLIAHIFYQISGLIWSIYLIFVPKLIWDPPIKIGLKVKTEISKMVQNWDWKNSWSKLGSQMQWNRIQKLVDQKANVQDSFSDSLNRDFRNIYFWIPPNASQFSHPHRRCMPYDWKRNTLILRKNITIFKNNPRSKLGIGKTPRMALHRDATALVAPRRKKKFFFVETRWKSKNL